MPSHCQQLSVAIQVAAAAVLLCCVILLQLPHATSAACTDAAASCINGPCNTTTGVCSCPTGSFLTFTDTTRCDNASAISTGATVSNVTQNNASFVQSGRVVFTNTVLQGGFPIGDSAMTTSMFICSNGYVTFGSNFCTTRIGLLLNAAAPAFVAPFATSFDYRSIVGTTASNSKVSYSIVGSVDSVPQLKLMRDGISDLAGTKSAIVVTWSKMSPPTIDYSAAVQWITMQLIIFTDRQNVTMAVMLYTENTMKHYFDWVPTIVAWKAAGSSSSAVTLAGTRSASMAFVNQRVSVGGLNARMRIVPLFRGAGSVNYGALCSDESQAPVTVPAVAAIASLCPQVMQQARSDPRYSKDSTVTVGKQTYSLVLTASVENATQLTCVYHNATGGLLVQESTIKIVSKGVSLGVNLYDLCCNKAPSQCSLYYTKYPQPSSATYTIPTFAGFITGAGIFRTFDSHQFKYMSIGDFWLVSSDKLKVQVRMQNTNQMANRTAAVAAVALQFTGATNITLELYWNRISQIFAWHYSVNQGSFMNITSVNATVQTAISNNAVIIGSNSKVVCYTQNTGTWIEILSGSNGLTVTIYLDRSGLGVTSGPLGNSDGNNQNDVAYKNGTALNATQQADQAALGDAMASWTVVPADSLFRISSTPPTPTTGWSALYWNPAYDTNQTLLTIDLFGGNATVYSAAAAACAAKAGNTTENRLCLMEFSDCLAQACPAAYLTRLDAVPATLLDLGCTPPQWNSTAVTPPLNVKEGVFFTVSLATYIVGGASGRVFTKVAGPVSLTVSADGNLTWPMPNQTDATSALIVLGVGNNATGCTSLWPVRIRMTRRDGLCPANSAESLGFQSNTVNAVTPQNQVTVSACACSTNYYGSNCSLATCSLNCFACGTAQTDCSVACPTNYDSSMSNTLTICAYRDRCDLTACLGGTYTACVSADPAIQTDTYKYQCSCTTGYQYPMANPADKTRCEDTNECLNPLLCDLTANKTCANTPGSFSCSCSPGYGLVGTSCLDINECLNATLYCPRGTCNNTAGSYVCNCNAGYYQDTPTTCMDINECANPTATKCTHQCVNTDGSFTCNCNTGFAHPSGDPITCIAQANCTTPASCLYSAMCAKVSAVDTCYCYPGQTQSGTACTPTTFCQPNICGTGGACAESNPGYTCSCAAYYELNNNGTCIKSPYCTYPAKYPSVCPAGNIVCTTNATTNAPTCGCATGYANSSANVCIDVNECSGSGLNSCNQGSTDCYNTIGSYSCVCKFGYKRQNATYCTPAPFVYQVNATFTDLTYTSDLANSASDAFKQMAEVLRKRFEAALPSDGPVEVPTVRVFGMASGSVVATTVASYSTSTTPDAIKATASSAGVAASVGLVNECLDPTLNDCNTEHNCIDTDAGYMCQCKIGYTQTGVRAGYPPNKVIADCVDINECLLECKNSSNKVCANLPGSYTCSCVNGTYSPDPKTASCDDPCVAGRCKNSGICQYQKTDAFPYKCVCVAGYTGFNCELSDDNYNAMQRNAVIIGVVLGVLLLMALIVVICCIIRRRQQEAKQPESQALAPKQQQDSHELTPVVPAAAPTAAPRRTRGKDMSFHDSSVDRHSEGNYRGAQAVPMSDATIPRVQEGAKHPSTYENQGFSRDNARQRNDYF